MARREGHLNQKIYVQLYTGILEHLAEGAFTTDDFAIYVLLQLKADHKSGVVTTNTADIVQLFGGREQFGTGLKEASVGRTVRLSLERLKERGYINYQSTTSRKKYPVLIHKYVVRDGKFKDQMLDAFAPRRRGDLCYVQSPDYLSTKEQGLREDSVKTPSGLRDGSLKTPSRLLEDSVKTPSRGSYYKEEEVRSKKEEVRSEEGRGAMVFPNQNLTDFSAGEMPVAPPQASTVDLITKSLLELTMPNTTREGAVRLCHLLYAASSRTPSGETLTDAIEAMAGLIEAGPDWKTVRARVLFVAVASQDYPMEGKNGPFTWFDAICGPRTKDPVASFKSNYVAISAATDECLAETEQHREREKFIAEHGGIPDHANATVDAAFAAAVE